MIKQMTKRDWFAAMAMQGYLVGDPEGNLKSLVGASFEVANRMCKESARLPNAEHAESIRMDETKPIKREYMLPPQSGAPEAPVDDFTPGPV